MASEPSELYRLVRQLVGDDYPECVGEQEGCVSEPFVDWPDVRRFFARVGVEPKGRNAAGLAATLDDVAAAVGKPRPVVERVLGIFCSGRGIPERAICAKVPRCSACPISGQCRFFERKPSIKQLPENERPRERLICQGESVLSSAELLGILIGGGTIEETAVDLGRRLLKQASEPGGENGGDLRRLSAMTIGEICRVKGLGPAKAARLKAAFELARRLMAEKPREECKQFCSSRAIFDAFYPAMRDMKKETFSVMMFDSKNHLIKTVQVSEGSLSSSVVHPREVFNPAVRESASAVVFIHNHPSGDPTPSQEDARVTARLKEAGELMGIRVLDHIVIGEGRYYSFLDEGAL